MFELDDDFDFDDDDFDKICTGKALEKSAKFSSIKTNAEEKSKESKEDESIFNEFTDDNDELLLSVIEPEPPFKENGLQKNESEVEIVDLNEPEEKNPPVVKPGAETSSAQKRLAESSFSNTPESKPSSSSSCTSRDSSASFTPIVCQRKFPGPAGLLPKRTPNGFSDSHASVLLDLNFDDCSSLQKTVICSQNSTANFEAGPWRHLIKDFRETKEEDSLLHNFTVAWVKRKAIARQFVKNRVPFLAALLTSLDCSAVDKVSGPVVLLKDPTGEIHGTLHREAWDQFGHYLSIGSVLILRHVAVYSAGISAQQQYLNITPKSIAVIYPTDVSSKIEVLPVTTQEVIEKITEWKKITLQSSNDSPSVKSSTQNSAPRSLFNSGRSIHHTKSSPCLGEPATKRPCNEFNVPRRNNVPSPFPLSSHKNTNLNNSASTTNSNSRIHLNNSPTPHLSNSSSKISQISSSTPPPNNNSKLYARGNIDSKVPSKLVESNPIIKTKENKVPENKTMISGTSKINKEDLSEVTSILEGIDADMFDDF